MAPEDRRSEQCHVDAAGCTLARPGGPLGRLVGELQDVASVGEEHPAGIGQFHSTGCPGEQRSAEFVLELSDLACERGLGDVEPLPRRARGAASSATATK